jgi:hypothetical protein
MCAFRVYYTYVMILSEGVLLLARQVSRLLVHATRLLFFFVAVGDVFPSDVSSMPNNLRRLIVLKLSHGSIRPASPNRPRSSATSLHQLPAMLQRQLQTLQQLLVIP